MKFYNLILPYAMRLSQFWEVASFHEMSLIIIDFSLKTKFSNNLFALDA